MSSSYILNEYICVPGPGEARNLYRMECTSQSITVFTASDLLPISIFSDHTHSRNWFRSPWSTVWNRTIGDIQPDRFGGNPTDPLANRSVGYTDCLYGDGHVETIAAAQIFKHCIDRDNFAVPPS